jgi:hypothetical protein
MLVNRRKTLGAILIVAVFALMWGIDFVIAEADPYNKIRHCEKIEDGGKQVDCVYRVISSELNDSKFVSALDIFNSANEAELTDFNKGECHRHAHNFGHFLYYEIFLQKGGFDAIEFPQGSTVCSYGIFHGFLEHLVQDNPYQSFVTKTCNYLDEELGDTMRDIKRTCYHASGHGFMMNYAERVDISDWGKLSIFANKALEQCDRLPNLAMRELEECREGIFNVGVNWMTDEQFGFKFDNKNPFAQCDKLDSSSHKLCYREISRKMDSVSDFDPITLQLMLEKAHNPELALSARSVALGGIVRKLGFEKTLSRCKDGGKELFKACVSASIYGLYEAGLIQEEYKEPMKICENNLATNNGLREFCYKTVSMQLTRFYTQNRIRSICNEFPKDVRHFCKEQLK